MAHNFNHNYGNKVWLSTTYRFDSHQFGIRKLTPVRDACAKFPNFAEFIVAKTTEKGQNYSPG
jgi:hypothetical protein